MKTWAKPRRAEAQEEAQLARGQDSKVPPASLGSCLFPTLKSPNGQVHDPVLCSRLLDGHSGTCPHLCQHNSATGDSLQSSSRTLGTRRGPAWCRHEWQCHPAQSKATSAQGYPVHHLQVVQLKPDSVPIWLLGNEFWWVRLLNTCAEMCARQCRPRKLAGEWQ